MIKIEVRLIRCIPLVLTNREAEYESDDRICVSVCLGDILNQGGLVYTVTSLPSYINAFFCTLPKGMVEVTLNS